MERMHVLFVMIQVKVRYVGRIFNGHFRWIHGFKVVSKTKRLPVEDKTVGHLSIIILFIRGDHCIRF